MNLASPIECEPAPIEIDPRPCRDCGLTIDKHRRVDTPEGPEFFCDEAEIEIQRTATVARLRMELNDPRDREMARVELGLMSTDEPPLPEGPEAYGLPIEGEAEHDTVQAPVSASLSLMIT